MIQVGIDHKITSFAICPNDIVQRVIRPARWWIRAMYAAYAFNRVNVYFLPVFIHLTMPMSKPHAFQARQADRRTESKSLQSEHRTTTPAAGKRGGQDGSCPLLSRVRSPDRREIALNSIPLGHRAAERRNCDSRVAIRDSRIASLNKSPSDQLHAS